MRRKLSSVKGARFRALKVAACGVLASGSISLFGLAAAHAAVLSVGSASNPFGAPFSGYYYCADVSAGSLAYPNKVQAWPCHAGPNQQFELLGETIYALGGQRCLDVQNAATAAGTPVNSYTCNGSASQKWYYWNGQIINLNGDQYCLDATSMTTGTHLVINPCNDSTSQQWQIK
jgi:hypothetical protein